MIKAEIVADSINPNGERITTFLVTFPRIVLAEINTHRAFSRNSASSRAIPFKKMVLTVNETPFIPKAWMKEHSGMQGTAYFTGTANKEFNTTIFEDNLLAVDRLTDIWLEAMDYMLRAATGLNELGVSKQICNRLLEPFMYHTALITATNYENFFAQRAHPAAEIHLEELAQKMLVAYNESKPKSLQYGEWHIPFGDRINSKDLHKYTTEDLHKRGSTYYDSIFFDQELTINKLKIATAFCAGVSYTVAGDDGKPENIAKLIDRHDNKLVKLGHWSPFEHCAQPVELIHPFPSIKPDSSKGLWFDSDLGNFKGWKQYRKFFNDENRTDSRVIKQK